MGACKRVDAVGGCSYFVLMSPDETKGDRWLRLGDLAAHEVIMVRCPCGRSVEYPPGFLQRRYRLASDTLVFDLQFRLRCKGCNRRGGFRITIFDERARATDRGRGWSGWSWRGKAKT